MKIKISFPFVLEFIVAIFIALMVQPVSAGDGITHYWGIFAGISDYQTQSDLDFAADDASSIYNHFLQDSNWEASRMTLLQDSQATKAAIKNAVTTMASSADDDDICLFFFSGHGGSADSDFPPTDESDGKDEYLVCWDSNSTNYTGDFIDDEISDILSQISGTTVLLLDSCFSGGHIKAADSKSVSDKIQASRNVKYIIKPFEQDSGRIRKGDGFSSDLIDGVTALKDASDQSDIIILTASDDDETSFENPEFQHGEFTYFLMLGLKSNDANKNGYVSIEEAFAYLNPAIVKYKNSTVTPQKYDATSSETDILQPIAERIVFVGFGDFSWDYPFNTYYLKQRAEYIYSHSQLGQSGYIKTLKIFVEEKPNLSLQNCTIRMQHTTESEYNSTPPWTSSGWTTVYTGTKTINNLGAVSFTLLTPFYYDGTRNIIIDFSFSNSSDEDSGKFTGSYSDTYSMIYHSRDDDNYGEPTTWSGSSPQSTRDENSPATGSYLDLEFEFYTEDDTNAMPWIPLLLLDN